MSRRRKSEESQGKHRTAKRRMGVYPTSFKALEDDSYEDVDSVHDADGLFVEQSRAPWDRESKKDKAAKSNQVKYLSQHEEEGKTDSQRFIDVLKTSKKKKGMKKGTKYLEDIKHIVDGQAEITGNLGAMAHKSSSLEAQFSEFFVVSHQMVAADILSAGRIRPGRQISLKDASTSITKNGHQLLVAVDRLGLELGSHVLSPMAKEQEWDENVLNVERILEGGNCVGRAKAATLLTGPQIQELQSGDSGDSGAIFGDAMDSQGIITWADVAAKQGKAVGKLALAFSRE